VFRTAPVVEPAPDAVDPADLVPLSHLELDHFGVRAPNVPSRALCPWLRVDT
jgi:hypothetical protein